ncbi:hypothetical protein KIV56_15355 [Cryobacterium breve]|uniref:Ig-like domain repeat protein n=1 Tax=Cryobacterium breve TaxID=1259258 RepID=A0ABY7NDH3_9MICO|nr:hypothetical protein [Cryobacterium breve]WBM79640.1 hypothetical protein KIV56_15355 [Cryobacterium breve]
MMAAGAQADDNGVVALTVSVADQLPTGPVEIHCTLPVGARADSSPVFITIHGLKPFSHVEVWVHSTPVLLVSGTADAAGDFSGSGTLPGNLEAGGHTIEVVGVTGAGDPFSQVAASFAITNAGTIGSATTGDANGVLSLVVPSAAVATFNAPVLVSNRSTTSGVLGSFAVSDARVLTREGWTVSADVADFVNAADGSAIGKTQARPRAAARQHRGDGRQPVRRPVGRHRELPDEPRRGCPGEPGGHDRAQCRSHLRRAAREIGRHLPVHPVPHARLPVTGRAPARSVKLARLGMSEARFPASFPSRLPARQLAETSNGLT